MGFGVGVVRSTGVKVKLPEIDNLFKRLFTIAIMTLYFSR